MITVLFFGQLKEQLGAGRLQVHCQQDTGTLDAVKAVRVYLQKQYPQWQDYLASGRALVAVNQELVDDHFKVNDNDEIAFFPPVTGG